MNWCQSTGKKRKKCKYYNKCKTTFMFLKGKKSIAIASYTCKIVIVLSTTVSKYKWYNLLQRSYAPLSLKTAVCHSPGTQCCFGYLSVLNLWVLRHPVIVHMTVMFQTGDTRPADLQHWCCCLYILHLQTFDSWNVNVCSKESHQSISSEEEQIQLLQWQCHRCLLLQVLLQQWLQLLLYLD